MAALILDASVLIGLLDTADVHHTTAVRDVELADAENRGLHVPASAYSETLVAFARARRVPEARTAITGMGITVLALTAAIAELAADLRARHPALRLPDALILATARHHEAELLTYDVRLARLARND